MKAEGLGVLHCDKGLAVRDRAQGGWPAGALPARSLLRGAHALAKRFCSLLPWCQYVLPPAFPAKRPSIAPTGISQSIGLNP